MNALSPTRLVLMGTLLVVAACGDTTEPTPTPMAATASVTSEADPPVAAPTPRVLPCEIERCVDEFVGALASGDLVVLTRSFTPRGLREASALQELSGSTGTGEITLARVECIERSGDRYEVCILVDSPEGSARLNTTWTSVPGGAWRVEALTLLP